MPWVNHGRAPFLTRSPVFVGENWHKDGAKARRVLCYAGVDDWRNVVAASVDERRALDYEWPESTQAWVRLGPGPPYLQPGERLDVLVELRSHCGGNRRSRGAHRVQVVGRGGPRRGIGARDRGLKCRL